MSLNPTFALTPRNPFHYAASQDSASLFCHGADFLPLPVLDYPTLYANDEFLFQESFAVSPGQNYATWNNRRKSRFLDCAIDLRAYGPQKQLALVFGFKMQYTPDARVLVYSDAGFIANQQLLPGDTQFLIEIDSLMAPMDLYFIHAGGTWSFKGITGYVI